MRCIIVDDEPLAQMLLENYAKRTDGLQVMGKFSNAIAARSFLDSNSVDLIFLDIQMPGMNGMELARTIERHTRIIFTTAFGQYAIEGFKVDALEYLQKPISYGDFLNAYEHAKRWFEQEKMDTLFVKNGQQRVRLDINHIIYIEAEKDYLSIHYDDGRLNQMILMKMKNIEQMLPSERFMRIHRSYIVSTSHITSYQKDFLTIGQHKIPISETYRPKIRDFIAGRTLQ